MLVGDFVGIMETNIEIQEGNEPLKYRLITNDKMARSEKQQMIVYFCLALRMLFFYCTRPF